jgi:DNA-binding NarL/FixJ family response regulator
MTESLGTSKPSARRRVLLADNSPDLAEVLGEMVRLEPSLEYVGHVTTGEEACARALGASVDVLVLDLGLEDISGFEVLDRLASAGSTVKVIVHTGYSSGELAAHAKKKGAAAFVVKDGDVSALISAIQTV